MEMFNKILVAIDNSTRSRKVFEAGMFLAKTIGASLMLLQVLSSEEKNYPSPFRYYGQPFQGAENHSHFCPQILAIIRIMSQILLRNGWQSPCDRGRRQRHHQLCSSSKLDLLHHSVRNTSKCRRNFLVNEIMKLLLGKLYRNYFINLERAAPIN